MRDIIAFAHIPKTAGTTLISILRNSYRTQHFDRPGFTRPLTAKDLRQVRKVYRGLKSIAGHTVRPYTDLDQAEHAIRYYTFLRQPNERTISDFKFYLRRGIYDGKTFNDLAACWDIWLAQNNNFQCVYLSGKQDAELAKSIISDRITFVGLVEQFNESLLMLRKWVDDPCFNIHYTARNQADGKTESGRVCATHMRRIDSFCAAILNQDMLRDQLNQANAEDAKLYEYVSTSLYVQQKTNYGDTLSADLKQFEQHNKNTKLILSEPLRSKLFRDIVWKAARPFLLDVDSV